MIAPDTQRLGRHGKRRQHIMHGGGGGVARGAPSRVVRAVVLAVLSIVAATGGGCVQVPEEGLRQLIEANQDYRNGKYGAATAKLDDFLSRYSAFRESAEAYYLRALCHAEQSHRPQAAEDARRCIEKSGDRELAARAHATLATLLYEQGRAQEALPHYAQAMPHLPERPPKDQLRFAYGECLQRAGRWQEARLEFAAVFQRYSGSAMAGKARMAYEWPHEFFAIQCGAFRESSGARDVASRLRLSGLSAWSETRMRSGERLNFVYVGKYPTYDEARAALASVRRTASDALIVP